MKNGKHSGDAAPKKKGRKALLAVCIILAVLAVLFAAYSIWERPPEVMNPAPAETQKPQPAQASSTSAPEETDPPENEEAEGQPLVTDRAPGTYTFLLVGRDYASNSTDTIIMGRMDTKAHTIRCVNIPRDTLINISWANTPKKINAVYPGFINSGKNGIDGLKEQIRNLAGFDVDCYAVVSIKAVEEAVDAIGGVWFDVPVDMDYEDPYQDLTIHIPAGYQLLDGEKAVKVCRYRNGYPGADIDRINVQQSFLKTCAKQMLTLGNIPNLGELVDILVENLDTDLTAANIAWFARQFLQCRMEDISFSTLPWNTGCYINGVSCVSTDLNAWLELVNSSLNPYVDPVTVENVNILTSNYDGTQINSTTGVINGGPDSFYCMSCTIKHGGTAVHHLPGCCPPDEPAESPDVTEPQEPAETPEETESAEPQPESDAPEVTAPVGETAEAQ